MASGLPATIASRSASAMPVSRPLMRTSRRGRWVVVDARLRKSIAAVRAISFRSGAIESSKSRMTASAPLTTALSSFEPPSAGTNKRERIAILIKVFVEVAEFKPNASVVRGFGAGLRIASWGSKVRGGITHGTQKVHNTFGCCLHRRPCYKRDGTGPGPAADVRDHQG